MTEGVITCAICGDQHGRVALNGGIDSPLTYMSYVSELQDVFHGNCLLRLIEAAGRLHGIDYGPLLRRLNLLSQHQTATTRINPKWHVGHVPLSYSWKEAK